MVKEVAVVAEAVVDTIVPVDDEVVDLASVCTDEVDAMVVEVAVGGEVALESSPVSPSTELSFLITPSELEDDEELASTDGDDGADDCGL